MNLFANICSSGMGFVVVINALYPFRLAFQKDAKKLDKKEREKLEARVKSLAEQLGIKKKVEILEVPGLTTKWQALGCNLFSGKIGVALDPNFSKEEHLLAHELVHIKNNDNLILGSIWGIAGIITMLTLAILFPSSAKLFSRKMLFTGSASPAALGGVLLGLIPLVLTSRKFEERADKQAFSVCSLEGKKDAGIYFKFLQTINKKTKSESTSELVKMLFDKDGNDRLDILHPPLIKRIEWINELQKNEKITGLMNFLYPST